MSECESVAGAWGHLCPDCGALLPLPPRVRSWKSGRPLPFPSGSSAGLGARTVSASVDLTPRQIEVIEAVRHFDGNRSRAARLLGCTVTNVYVVLRKARSAGAVVPRGARRGPDLRRRTRRVA